MCLCAKTSSVVCDGCTVYVKNLGGFNCPICGKPYCNGHPPPLPDLEPGVAVLLELPLQHFTACGACQTPNNCARAGFCGANRGWFAVSQQHDHAGFEITFGDPLGRPVDRALLGRFVGAAFDSCVSCQDAQLTLMIEDPATTARLVELACVATDSLLGGLPAGMTDEHAPGLAAPEFRRLARAGLDGANDAMFTACADMTSTERRAAANTAADILIGQLVM